MKLALLTFLAPVSSTLQLQNYLLRNCPLLPDDEFNSYITVIGIQRRLICKHGVSKVRHF